MKSETSTTELIMAIPYRSDETTSKKETGLYFLKEMNRWELFASDNPTEASYPPKAEDQHPPGPRMTSQAIESESCEINTYH